MVREIPETFKRSLTSGVRSKSFGVNVRMKAPEQYFPLVLFIIIYYVVQGGSNCYF